MDNNIVSFELNPKKNLIQTFQRAVLNGDIEDFMIVGKYRDSDDFFVGKTEMSTTKEITLAAQLQAAVNIRAAAESNLDF